MICFDCVTIKRSRQDVIDNVTLTIDAGEAVAFVGESGAGKSSLLLALASVLPLHRGDITVDNLSVRTNAAAVRGRVGYVPACLSAWPAMQATEFLQLFAISAGLCGKPLRSAIDKALALAGMDSSGKQTVDSLCSGQAKRLLIARALLHDPPVLIFDDPFSGLDYKERILVEQIISDAVIMNRIVVAAVDNAVVRFIVDHPTKATLLLEQEELYVMEQDVVVIEIDNKADRNEVVAGLLVLHWVDPRATDLVVLGRDLQRPTSNGVDHAVERLVNLPNLFYAELPNLRLAPFGKIKFADRRAGAK